MSRGESKAMITRDAPELSLSRQCRLLSIGRPSFYYAPRGESPSSLALMRRIDELFMKYPFYGSRQMVRQLRRDGRLRRPSPGSQVDAIDRPGGDLSGAENQRAASHAPDFFSKGWLSTSPIGSGAPTSPISPSSVTFCTW